jgi:hypothetical protein
MSRQRNRTKVLYRNFSGALSNYIALAKRACRPKHGLATPRAIISFLR